MATARVFPSANQFESPHQELKKRYPEVMISRSGHHTWDTGQLASGAQQETPCHIPVYPALRPLPSELKITPSTTIAIRLATSSFPSYRQMQETRNDYLLKDFPKYLVFRTQTCSRPLQRPISTTAMPGVLYLIEILYPMSLSCHPYLSMHWPWSVAMSSHPWSLMMDQPVTMTELEIDFIMTKSLM